MNGASDQLHHLVLHDFLTLRLHNVVGEVLAHVFVGAGSKAYDGLSSRVADIDTDEHGLHGAKHLRELHGK